MDTCIFCKILKNEIPSTKVYEDENVIGIKDIKPIYETHILFITKNHINSIADLDLNEQGPLNHVFNASLKYCQDNGIDKQGFRNMINHGEGFQEVPHIHLHLFAGKRL